MDKGLKRALERFDLLPDSANVSSKVTAAILGVSERTIRYHPLLPRIYTSPKRYNYNVGRVRKLARDGMS